METLQGSYNPILVLLSFAVSVVGSFTALQVARRIPKGAGTDDRLFWIGSAAFAMGGGAIWSMHFIGMVAFDLGVYVSYDLLLTAISLVLAVGVTGAAFAWLSHRGSNGGHVLGAGLLMGLGIAAMHYTGMAAMRMPASLAYRPALVVLSVIIAIFASSVALWLSLNPASGRWRVAGAFLMGIAVCGMHYTAMAAAVFTRQALSAGQQSSPLSPEILAYSVFLLTLVILSILMGLSVGLGRQEDRPAVG